MRSIAQLSAEANAYEFSAQISFASWIHVSRTLLHEALNYDAEGTDLERAFILNLRYADLVLNRLPKHPAYSKNKAVYNKALSQVPVAIKRSEALKNKLEARKIPISKPQAKPKRRSSFELSADALERELQKFYDEDTEVPEIDLNSLVVTEPVKKPQNVRRQTSPRPDILYPSFAVPNSSGGGSTTSTTGTSAVQQPTDTSKQFDSIYQTERGQPLRTVFVPNQLRHKFLEIAEPNTRANLETCGMLCGKLRNNAFFVTDLVIPSQESTSDSCATTNEEELFEYVDSRDLFIIGWIHTHPTQTCFMSSIDLHTHASYQLMLPEAIAVVCAPTASPDWGAFRLTDPPGIDVIKNCKLTGFHQHDPNDNLYKAARPGGHYKEIKFDLVAEDLRSKK